MTPTRIDRVIHRPSRSTASTRVIASVIIPMRLKVIPTAVMIAERQASRAQSGHLATSTKTEPIAKAPAKAIESPKTPSARMKPPLGCKRCQAFQAAFGMRDPDERVEAEGEFDEAEHGRHGGCDGDAGVQPAGVDAREHGASPGIGNEPSDEHDEHVPPRRPRPRRTRRAPGGRIPRRARRRTRSEIRRRPCGQRDDRDARQGRPVDPGLHADPDRREEAHRSPRGDDEPWCQTRDVPAPRSGRRPPGAAAARCAGRGRPSRRPPRLGGGTRGRSGTGSLPRRNLGASKGVRPVPRGGSGRAPCRPRSAAVSVAAATGSQSVDPERDHGAGHQEHDGEVHDVVHDAGASDELGAAGSTRAPSRAWRAARARGCPR